MQEKDEEIRENPEELQENPEELQENPEEFKSSHSVAVRILAIIGAVAVFVFAVYMFKILDFLK